MDIVAIRGATTADADTKEAIESASIELYNEILCRNNIVENDIIYVQISSTVDLRACYPATALRLNGCNVPLFSCQEPQIDGSLDRCIRFLLLIKTANSINSANATDTASALNAGINHVYLKKAVTLKTNKENKL